MPPRSINDAPGTTPDADPGAVVEVSELDVIEGTTILFGGRYELLSLVGAGAYGSVYRAADTELEEIVAVKVLRNERLAQPGALARFRKEVRLARRVSHPNVARTYDIGRHQGEPFLTMEYIAGVPLTHYCPIGAQLTELLPIRLILLLFEQLCSGLGALHTAGVVHRDLKTDNVLVGHDARVIITDFGIASALSDPECTNKHDHWVSGTPAYMAPEQVSGVGRIDTRADLYALGVMLFQMLTGQLPFSGKTGQEIALARLYEAPKDPLAIRPQLPQTLAALLRRCLARDPALRFQTADELAGALYVERPSGPELLDYLKMLPGRGGGVPLSTTIDLPGEGELSDHALAATNAGHTTPAMLRPIPPRASRQLPVAVLLFRGIGVSVEEYLVHGLTDELIDRLSESAGLRVTSAAVVRGLLPDAREPRMLGQKLMVKVILDGSLRRSAAGLQAVVRLIDVDSRLQFAVRRFAQPDCNILALAIEIARVIGELLTAPVEGGHGALLSDPQAVDLYLRARHQYNRMDPGGTQQSVQLFEQAIARVPDEPTLLTGYANALVRRWFYSGDQGAERAIAAVEKAIQAAPHSGQPYLALANLRLNEFQPVAAAAAVNRALAREPGLAEAHEIVGLILSETGPLAAALHQLNHSIVLDKSVPRVRMNLARTLMLSGDPEAAFDLLRMDDCEPGFVRILTITQARGICWLRDEERARALLRNPVMSLSEHQAARRRLQLLLGEQDGSADHAPLASYRSSTASPRARGASLQLRAEDHCLRQEYEAALSALRGAIELGFFDILVLDHCPLLAPLHRLSGYAELRNIVAQRAHTVQIALGVGTPQDVSASAWLEGR